MAMQQRCPSIRYLLKSIKQDFRQLCGLLSVEELSQNKELAEVMGTIERMLVDEERFIKGCK
jgi:hypothetical protein